MTQESQKNIYLLLDSKNTPIARGQLEGPANGSTWQIRVLDDKIDAVLEHQEFRLLSMTKGGKAQAGRLLRSRNDMIQLEIYEIDDSNDDMRQNLRVPTDFTSFIYPVSGRWRGRRTCRALDLSCGGIAFSSESDFGIRERVELVIPVTSQPLLLRGEILRCWTPEDSNQPYYAAKFYDMCNDEEMLVREAVFSLQLDNRPKHSNT